MKNAPLVSIIVPVYNSEDTLNDCVDSILRQSYTNIEVLLIDDGSTDSSPELCDNYSRINNRVRVFHQANRGISGAQNLGLEEARGKYLTFCDDDDLYSIAYVSTLLEAIARTGADIAKGKWEQFGVSGLHQTIAKSQILSKPSVLTKFNNPLQHYETVFSKILRIIGGSRKEALYFNEANWGNLYRASLWDGIRFPEGHLAQDLMVLGPILEKAKLVASVDSVIYYWRQSDSSVTHSKKSFTFYDDAFTAAKTSAAIALNNEVLPLRSVYHMKFFLKGSKSTKDFNQQRYKSNEISLQRALSSLTIGERLQCALYTTLRMMENMVYDHTIFNLK